MRALLGGILSIFGGIYAIVSVGSVIGQAADGPSRAQIAAAGPWDLPADLLATGLAVLAVLAGVWLLRGACRD